MFIKIFLFLLTIATPIFSNPIILDSDWEILEEKYERKDGVPEEVLNPKNFKWKQISRNETALNSENKKYKLIRIPIKEHSFKEPVIFLNRNIFSIRVFQNKKIIYKFSDDKQFLPSSFLGWIWHEIILKKEKKVSYIYFEFYSEIDFPFPIPLLYEREEFKREFIKNNLMSFFISIFSILLGIFLLINYFFKTKEYIYLSLASFYIFLGTWLLNIHEFIQYLVPITPTRLQIEYLSMYVSPVFALWFIELNFPSRANK
ncbi:MAG: hypothetical protein KDK36_03755, partial [Leptospiraceae bacterium]|nr:hypothetical protein [Leptospiraceae bacterium]